MYGAGPKTCVHLEIQLRLVTSLRRTTLITFTSLNQTDEPLETSETIALERRAAGLTL